MLKKALFTLNQKPNNIFTWNFIGAVLVTDLVSLSFLNSFGGEKFQYGCLPSYGGDAARGIVKSFKIWESNSFQKAVLSEYRKIWTVLCFIIKQTNMFHDVSTLRYVWNKYKWYWNWQKWWKYRSLDEILISTKDLSLTLIHS